MDLEVSFLKLNVPRISQKDPEKGLLGERVKLISIMIISEV